MYLGAFPFYAIAGWVGLLPTLFWEQKVIQKITSKFESISKKIFDSFQSLPLVSFLS
jgi:hypothetical protein